MYGKWEGLLAPYEDEGWDQEPGVEEREGAGEDEVDGWESAGNAGTLKGPPWGRWPKTPLAASAAKTEGLSGAEKREAQSALID